MGRGHSDKKTSRQKRENALRENRQRAANAVREFFDSQRIAGKGK